MIFHHDGSDALCGPFKKDLQMSRPTEKGVNEFYIASLFFFSSLFILCAFCYDVHLHLA